MPTLSDVLQHPERRTAVLRDSARLLDDEVAARGGVSGLGVKAAFGMVKAVKPGIIAEVLESLLPDFAKALEPLLAARPPEQRVGAWLELKTPEVVQALLSVTDERAKRSTHATLTKAYTRLRPMAEKQVAQSVPGLARLVDRHVEALASVPAPAAAPMT
jgi:hypothetical protein